MTSPKNTFPKLHNAMWPGLVGKEPGTDHPPIGLDRMLELTAGASVNGQKFDGVDLFLFHSHNDPDASDDDLRRLADKIAGKGLAVGSVVAPVWPGTVGGSAGEHHLTFSGPVALPGVSLGPGTYIFRKPASNVLQVTNANRVPYAMVMTRPISRTARTDRYEVVLGSPLSDGSPRRIEAWFAPGESTGQQLMYKR